LLLDTHLKTSEERLAFVNNLLADPNFTPSEAELEWMANYLTYPLEVEERRERKIMTDNRKVTIEAHETSFDSLASKFEAGDDALEAISQSRTSLKERITPRKRPITQRELNEVPGLRAVRDASQFWYQKSKTSTGRAAYIASRSFREDSALMYTLRDAHYPIITSSITPNYTNREPEYGCEEGVDSDGKIWHKGYSLMNKDLCAVLLKHYIKLKGKN
jgi:hypothetical protein